MTRTKTARFAALLAVAALIGAACGGDDDDDASSATTAAAAAATTTAAAAQSDATTDTTEAATEESTAPAGSSAGSGSASSAEWDAVVAAAKDEGKVTFYTAQGLDQANQVKAAFEKAYPEITVDVVRDISSNLIPKLEAERQTGNGIADVYVSADTAWWATTAQEGHIIPMTGPAFDDPAYDRAELIHDDTYFEVSAVVFGYGWNTDKVPDGLKAMTDVLDPKYEGKVGVVEPSLEALVDFYKYLEETYGKDFVTKLAAQHPRIYPGAGPLREALAAGEVDVSTYSSPMTDMTAKGAPVAWTIPETAWGARFYGGIVDSSPNQNAAQLFADFLVSKDGQVANVFNESVAVLPDIPGTGAEITAIRRAPSYTPEEVTAYQDEWRKLFQS
jgi:iron(III) transport system substrate-binding protein